MCTLAPGPLARPPCSCLPGAARPPAKPAGVGVGRCKQARLDKGLGRSYRRFRGGDEVSLICSLSQQITLSPSLFNPEEFMPLDPTQEPIFPPELLVGDAPRRGPAKSVCHEPLETHFIHTNGDLCVLVLWVFLSPSDTGGQVPLSHTPKGTHTCRTHVTLSTESGSLQDPVQSNRCSRSIC